MSEKPLVSVVITCHNYGRFLGEAIESVLAQTYRPLEVIVVDDGSTDDSQMVAKRYPVKLLAQTNQGVCAATNNGIRASTGDFVMRLDADDKLAATYVEETLAALNTDPTAAFAYSGGTYFGNWTGPVPLRPFDPEALAEGAYVMPCALMRRSAFERVGGYNEMLSRLRSEDWDLWLTFAELGMRGVLVDRPLWQYRKHGRSRVSATISPRGIWREYAMIRRLQDNHPALFAADALERRLARLPARLWRREVSLRFVLLLTAFYSIMLLRHTLGRTDARASDIPEPVTVRRAEPSAGSHAHRRSG